MYLIDLQNLIDTKKIMYAFPLMNEKNKKWLALFGLMDQRTTRVDSVLQI